MLTSPSHKAARKTGLKIVHKTVIKTTPANPARAVVPTKAVRVANAYQAISPPISTALPEASDPKPTPIAKAEKKVPVTKTNRPFSPTRFTALVLALFLSASLSACAHGESRGTVDAHAQTFTHAQPLAQAHPLEAPTPPNSRSPRWPTRPVNGANTSTDVTQTDLRHFAQDWGGQALRILHLGMLSDQPPFSTD